MKWIKRGLVWAPDGKTEWQKSHAMLPTPYLRDDGQIRVIVTCRDSQGRGRPFGLTLDPRDPSRILEVDQEPLLDIGLPGCFDSNGLVVSSMLQDSQGRVLMYFNGFELCRDVPYRILAGLALSEDRGKTFKRWSQAPLLERSNVELYFRCAPHVHFHEGRYKMWYIAGSAWTDIKGKQAPVYDLHYMESADGIHWPDTGQHSMALGDPDEHGFGRPWIVLAQDRYQLFYSIRRRSKAAYRLGYAESSNGIDWERKDEAMGLDVSPGSFDGLAIEYSAVLAVGTKTYCFYNGDEFGKAGFAFAELESPS